VIGRAVLLALVVVALLVRLVVVPVLRPRHPGAAAALERHWAWLPFAALGVGVTWALGWPGLALTALAVVVVASRPDLFGLPHHRPDGE
jgi:hypothetical protein